MSSSHKCTGEKSVRVLRSVLLGCSDTKMCEGQPWWRLSSCLKEAEGNGRMCSRRVLQAEQQIRRCWSAQALGASEGARGGQWAGDSGQRRRRGAVGCCMLPCRKATGEGLCCHHSPSFPVLPAVTARSSLPFRILSNYSSSSLEFSKMYETENQQQSKSRLD